MKHHSTLQMGLQHSVLALAMTLSYCQAQVEVRSQSGKVQALRPTFADSLGMNLGILRGVILSKTDSLPLPGVRVTLAGTGLGAVTGSDGTYEIRNVPTGSYELTISYLGHVAQRTVVRSAPGSTIVLEPLKMIEADIGLKEVKVIASFAKTGVTPITITEINQVDIEEKFTSAQGFPEVARFSPGIYVSQAGGGYGDLRINVRGFEQENTAVLLNGIPINDMEFGKVYWINWQNLTDVTRSFQVQHGMGVGKLAVNSVGGSMNIITRTTDIQAGGAISFETSTFGEREGAFLTPYQSTARFLISTGRMKGGKAFTFQGVRTWGGGYLQNGNIDMWGYFLSYSQELGSRHMLVFTAFGTPQRHNENVQSPTTPIAVFERQGRRYNPNWGTLNGEVIGGQNFYHKPQLALNHYFTINPKTSLNSSLYFSSGTGGGNFTPFGPRTRNGQWDYDLMRDITRGRADTTFADARGQVQTGRNAQFYTIDFRLDQWWAGLISTLSHTTSSGLQLLMGADLRTYRGDQFFQINNLIGGDFWIDSTNVNLRPVAARSGDRVWQSKTAYINWYGGFVQAEYARNRFTLFASASTVYTTYQRADYFMVPGTGTTTPYGYLAYSAKAGVAYRLTNSLKPYFNTGYFTRAPFFGNVFPFGNERQSLPLEKVMAMELGLSVTKGSFQANVATYYIRIADKTQNFERLTDPFTNSEFSALASGIAARHMGIEARASYQPITALLLSAFANVADWRFMNDATVQRSNPSRTSFTTIPLYINNLFTGNAPQMSVGGSANYKPGPNLAVAVDWVYYDKLYANLTNGRSDPNQRQQPWQLPAYMLINANVSYRFQVSDLNATLRLQVQNLLDRLYYSEGVDGQNSTGASSFVFTGYGRILTMGLTVRW